MTDHEDRRAQGVRLEDGPLGRAILDATDKMTREATMGQAITARMAKPGPGVYSAQQGAQAHADALHAGACSPMPQGVNIGGSRPTHLTRLTAAVDDRSTVCVRTDDLAQVLEDLEYAQGDAKRWARAHGEAMAAADAPEGPPPP